jgi:hypothetical protein
MCTRQSLVVMSIVVASIAAMGDASAQEPSGGPQRELAARAARQAARGAPLLRVLDDKLADVTAVRLDASKALTLVAGLDRAPRSSSALPIEPGSPALLSAHAAEPVAATASAPTLIDTNLAVHRQPEQRRGVLDSTSRDASRWLATAGPSWPAA